MSAVHRSTEPAKQAPEGKRSMTGKRAALEAERLGLVVMLVLVVVLFSVLPDTSGTFATSSNFSNITGNQSVLALIALAAIVPLVCGEFDVSIGAILGFSSVLSAYSTSVWGVDPIVAVLIGISAGGVVGLINGILVARVGVNSLITTLATGTVLAGLGSAISSVPIVAGVPDVFSTFGTSNWLGMPRPLFVLVLTAVGLYWFLEQTSTGRELHAIGSSAAASRLVGVSVDRLILRSFVISGLISGAAGVLQLARSGIGDPNVGVGFTLPAIAAAFLGATAIRPGRFNVIGAVVAIFFLAAVLSGLTIIGAQAWLQGVINGSALLIGIAISTVIARRRTRAL